MVADAYFLHLTLQADELLHRDRERLRAVGRRNHATVPVGLLDEVVVLLNQADIIAVQLLIPLDGGEISGRQQGLPKHLRRRGCRITIVAVVRIYHGDFADSRRHRVSLLYFQEK